LNRSASIGNQLGSDAALTKTLAKPNSVNNRRIDFRMNYKNLWKKFTTRFTDWYVVRGDLPPQTVIASAALQWASFPGPASGSAQRDGALGSTKVQNVCESIHNDNVCYRCIWYSQSNDVFVVDVHHLLFVMMVGPDVPMQPQAS
jgi:hypothetical protein